MRWSVLVEAVLFLFAVAALVALLNGCGPRTYDTKLPSYCYEEALFTAQHLRCVDRAATLEESQACRKAVDRSCGIAETVSSKVVSR